jgi:hypothetical protein
MPVPFIVIKTYSQTSPAHRHQNGNEITAAARTCLTGVSSIDAGGLLNHNRFEPVVPNWDELKRSYHGQGAFSLTYKKKRG